MPNCRKCGIKFPLFTLRDMKRPNPFGDGYLCPACDRPYRLVLEKYSANLENAAVNPQAAAWVAVCCLMAARRINLVRSVTAAIIKVFETEESWAVCRQRAREFANRAMAMLPAGSQGQTFLKAILHAAATIEEPPARQITRQRYASVWGDTILALEYEALAYSGISMDELHNYVASLPAHLWLLAPCGD